MTTRVVILRGAESDLSHLRQYVRQRFGARAWKDSLAAMRKAVRCIALHPLAGKLPVELVELNLVQFRQVLAGNNRIIYELRGNMAYVHVICDVRRDLRALLLRRLLEVPPG
jgi:plasmid stabilization system protein ParE